MHIMKNKKWQKKRKITGTPGITRDTPEMYKSTINILVYILPFLNGMSFLILLLLLAIRFFLFFTNINNT